MISKLWNLAISKHINFILSAVYILAVFIFIFFRYSFYYGLNDDILMKDMLSGAYTGTPASRSIYMLFPLSAFFSLFYRIMPNIPWYGLFMCSTVFFAIWLIALCTLRFCHNIYIKITLLVLQASIIVVSMLYYAVFVTFTATSGILMAAAAVNIVTCPKVHGDKATRDFMIYMIPTIMLTVISFNIRWNMSLLLFPFLIVAGIYHWLASQEDGTPILNKQKASRYTIFFATISLLMTLSYAISSLAYSTPDWQGFMQYRKNQDAILDYANIPAFNDHIEYYNEIGLSRIELRLITEWKFGFLLKNHEDISEKIAIYKKHVETSDKSFLTRVLDNMSNFNWFKSSAHIYLVLFGYMALLMTVLYSTHGNFKNRLTIAGKGVITWTIVLMLIIRTGLWGYMFYGGRFMQRVTYPLYIVEILVLFSIILRELAKSKYQKKFPIIAALSIFILTFSFSPWEIRKIDERVDYEAPMVIQWRMLQEYCLSNTNAFYIFTEGVFLGSSEFILGHLNPVPYNFEIEGSWIYGSPLYYEKQQYFFEMNNNSPYIKMIDMLLKNDNVFYVNRIGDNTSTLSDYYLEQGIEITYEAIDIVADTFEVLKITEVN